MGNEQEAMGNRQWAMGHEKSGLPERVSLQGRSMRVFAAG